MLDHFRMFARYNTWANARLYDAVALLSDADYRADRGAFFGSVHGTLNHLLLGDRLWMHRFTGEGPTYAALDLILQAFISAIDDSALAQSIRYQTLSQPAPIIQQLGSALAHFFNHQTHHRGQVHGLLSGFGRPVPSLDLIFFQRDTGVGLG